MLLLPLLLEATLLQLASGSYHPFYNGFYYNHVMNDKGNGHEKGTAGTGGAGARGRTALLPLGWGQHPRFQGYAGLEEHWGCSEMLRGGWGER